MSVQTAMNTFVMIAGVTSAKQYAFLVILKIIIGVTFAVNA